MYRFLRKLTSICWFTERKAAELIDIFLENKILRKSAIMCSGSKLYATTCESAITLNSITSATNGSLLIQFPMENKKVDHFRTLAIVISLESAKRFVVV
jgi:hypothetical protein